MSVENTHPCKVWSKFQGTRKDNSVVKLRIEDIEWDKHKEDIFDFIKKYFIKDEAYHKAAGISNNEDAIAEYIDMLNFFYDQQQPNVSACFIDDDPLNNTIVGISLTSVKKSQLDENKIKDLKAKTKEMQNLFNILKVIRDTKASKGYESFYEGRGISVRPDYRGMGIASEFVRLRKQICIENNVQMSCAWMTAIGTQKAADKYNWKTFVELPVEELGKKAGLTFEVNVPTFKLMYTTKD